MDRDSYWAILEKAKVGDRLTFTFKEGRAALRSAVTFISNDVNFWIGMIDAERICRIINGKVMSLPNPVDRTFTVEIKKKLTRSQMGTKFPSAELLDDCHPADDPALALRCS